jgi:enamine deaminase RidA (YjgF/YER057c/UK114 family)
MHEILQPEGWAKPVGYSNGVAARGRLVFVGGQIGWNGAGVFETDDLVGQIRQCLLNVVAVLRVPAAGGAPHLHDLVFHRQARLSRPAPGDRRRLSRGDRPQLPAMAAVEVSALVEDRARSRSRPCRLAGLTIGGSP